MKDSVGVSELLKPFDPSAMRCYAVSNRVNSVQNDDEECAKPIEIEATPQGHLFG
jgi:putative SOS response-associated peptidase YedK